MSGTDLGSGPEVELETVGGKDGLTSLNDVKFWCCLWSCR